MTLFISFLLELLFIGIVLYLIYYVLSSYTRNMKRRTETFEFFESTYNGAVEEPHAYRELTEDEKTILQEEYQNTKNFLRNKWTLIGIVLLIFIFLDIIFNLVFTDISDIYKQFNPQNQLILTSFCSGVLVLLFTLSIHNFENKLHADLRLPVWRVQGNVIYEYSKNEDIPNYDIPFQVRKIRFHTQKINYNHSVYGKNLQVRLKKQIREISNRDEITVLYSPFTKCIWDIRKV